MIRGVEQLLINKEKLNLPFSWFGGSAGPQVENIHKHLDLARKLNKTMKHKGGSDTNCTAGKVAKCFEKMIGWNGNQRKI